MSWSDPCGNCGQHRADSNCGNWNGCYTLKVGDKIEIGKGLKYEVVKVFDGNICDIKALQPQFEWMPDFYPVYNSIKLESFNVF